MEANSGESPAVERIERVGFASKTRGIIAGFLGCGLWVGVMVLYIEARAGASVSTLEVVVLILLSAAVTAAPCILSQMTRGQWALEDAGIKENIVPLLSFLPFGLRRERLVRWQDIESHGIKTVRVRNTESGRRARYRELHYFQAQIPGRPRIEIARKDRPQDAEFDGFVEAFSRRMSGVGALVLCAVLSVVSSVKWAPTAAASTDLGRLATQFDMGWQTLRSVAPPLGVAFVPLTDSDRATLGIRDGRGVRITEVRSGGLGERLGLKSGDIIIGFNGAAVRSAEEFADLVRSRDPVATPTFELFAKSAANPAASNTPTAAAASPPASSAAPIDCGPNPTVECAMRMLRESWKNLREAVK